jgi:thiol-disulfide isomerase/thioredoxin
MRKPPALVAVAALVVVAVRVAPAAAFADRTQVYSVQGADCADCGEQIRKELKKVGGVKKVEFDSKKVELTVRMDDGVSDEAVLSAVDRAGAKEGLRLKAVVGAGQGAYLPQEAYPAGTDVRTLTTDGSAVGPLEKLRVAGKHTVFDVYADWCGPCRGVDARLHEIVAQRADVAVRKLNVVDFDTPLAKELGSTFEALPYLIVFSPSGKKTEIVGADLDALDKALKAK